LTKKMSATQTHSEQQGKDMGTAVVNLQTEIAAVRQECSEVLC
jgi:hypothetical protein